ncbi:uncharacterized protein [Nicotiana tomentosiformis]|uniref:uncharacterized protein n=1 Tax=Nicotiana tomentosiformis TaxID=4098 RepID=UPI00388CEBB4
MNMWQQFKVRCVWQPTLENLVNENLEKRAQKRISNSHHVARKDGNRPDWIREDVWNQLLAKWNTPEWKKKSQQAKLNRASTKGGSLHTGGSISFAAHRLRMEKERGANVNYAEVFAETHKKKKKDYTREGWIEPRASETFDKYHIGLHAWRKTQPEGTQLTPEDMNAIWTQTAGGVESTGLEYSHPPVSTSNIIQWGIGFPRRHGRYASKSGSNIARISSNSDFDPKIIKKEKQERSCNEYSESEEETDSQ